MWGALVAGTAAVAAGRLDAVLLAVVVLVPLAAFELVAGLPGAAQDLVRARRSAARVREVLDARAPVREPAAPRALPAAPALRVRGLRARYGDDGPWALDGIDLDLSPGRRVAVVGPSGSGKSTLAAVLLRFLDYQERLGHARRRADRGARRRRPPHRGRARRAGRARVRHHRAREPPARPPRRDERRPSRRRSRAPGSHDRRTLDIEAGPGGRRLSGGQRRRIALARAELAGFPLVVLDEPGEHLDVATGDAIVADALASGRGTLLITHRLAGLEAMDEIVVLEAGRVAERGTHAELLRRGGRYAESWLREGGPPGRGTRGSSSPGRAARAGPARPAATVITFSA